MGIVAKAHSAKLSLSIIAVLIFSLAFVVLLYAERTNLLSSTPGFKSKSCAKKGYIKSTKKSTKDERNTTEDNRFKSIIDDRFIFDADECDVTQGKWVYNRSFKPLYTDLTCPYLDRQVSCVKNGKPDSDYRNWEWQLDDCILPRLVI